MTHVQRGAQEALIALRLADTSDGAGGAGEPLVEAPGGPPLASSPPGSQPCLGWMASAAAAGDAHDLALDLAGRGNAGGPGRPDEWTRVSAALEAWSGLGVTCLTIIGDDPPLHPEFAHVVRYARAVGFVRVATVTAGSRLAAERLRAVSPREVSAVTVRFSGGSSVTHDRVHGAGAYMDAVATAVDLARRDVVVQLLCAVNQANIHDVPRLIDVADRWGLGGVAFYPASADGRGRHATVPSLSRRAWLDFRRRVLPTAAAGHAATAVGVASAQGRDLAGGQFVRAGSGVAYCARGPKAPPIGRHVVSSIAYDEPALCADGCDPQHFIGRCGAGMSRDRRPPRSDRKGVGHA